MEHDFWQTRWREGRTAFHEASGSPWLQANLGRLMGDTPGRVLVPLCGKAHDMRVLAGAGHEVIGVELSAIAAEAFFSEWQVRPTVTDEGAFQRYQGNGVTILVGDFFELTPHRLGPVAHVFDRAAMVALPPEMRARYAPHLLGLLAPGARVLLITFEYDQSRAPGPPFSVEEDEVRSRFASTSIERLGEQAIETTSQTLRESGASLREVGWLLTLPA